MWVQLPLLTLIIILIMARILTFGKYKGLKVIDIIDSNPEYIKWAHKNVPYFKLTNEEFKKLFKVNDSSKKS